MPLRGVIEQRRSRGHKSPLCFALHPILVSMDDDYCSDSEAESARRSWCSAVKDYAAAAVLNAPGRGRENEEAGAAAPHGRLSRPACE
jgi:predicted alpha/beta hydrolase family esterase